MISLEKISKKKLISLIHDCDKEIHVTVSEKIDGIFVAFQWKNDSLYVKTNGSPWTNEYQEWFMQKWRQGSPYKLPYFVIAMEKLRKKLQDNEVFRHVLTKTTSGFESQVLIDDLRIRLPYVTKKPITFYITDAYLSREQIDDFIPSIELISNSNDEMDFILKNASHFSIDICGIKNTNLLNVRERMKKIGDFILEKHNIIPLFGVCEGWVVQMDSDRGNQTIIYKHEYPKTNILNKKLFGENTH